MKRDINKLNYISVKNIVQWNSSMADKNPKVSDFWTPWGQDRPPCLFKCEAFKTFLEVVTRQHWQGKRPRQSEEDSTDKGFSVEDSTDTGPSVEDSTDKGRGLSFNHHHHRHWMRKRERNRWRLVMEMFSYHVNQRSLSIIIHTKVHHNVIMIILLSKEKEKISHRLEWYRIILSWMMNKVSLALEAGCSCCLSVWFERQTSP